MRMSGECTSCGQQVEYDVLFGTCFDQWGSCRCPGPHGKPGPLPLGRSTSLTTKEGKMPHHDLSPKESGEKSRYSVASREHNLVEESLLAPECLGEVS